MQGLVDTEDHYITVTAPDLFGFQKFIAEGKRLHVKIDNLDFAV